MPLDHAMGPSANYFGMIVNDDHDIWKGTNKIQ